MIGEDPGGIIAPPPLRPARASELPALERSSRSGHSLESMTTDTGRALRSAAIAFACTVGFTTAVAVRDDLPGRPLGIGVPLSVPTGILVGWGAGVAAPWPMPVAALVASRRANQGDSVAALVCAGLGIAGIAGFLIEPNTYDPTAWTPANRNAIAAGLLASAALAVTGLRHWRRTRQEMPAATSA